MFSSSSPIWCFLNALGATFKDPEQARLATKGLYLMEVFPALALPSLNSGFFGRLAGPKYNPDRRKTFRKDDWGRVAEAAGVSTRWVARKWRDAAAMLGGLTSRRRRTKIRLTPCCAC